MRHLCDTGESREMRIEIENVINSSTPKLARNGLYLSPVLQRAVRWSKDTRHVIGMVFLLQSPLLKCNTYLFSP